MVSPHEPPVRVVGRPGEAGPFVVVVGTLNGFPDPPAMGSVERSSSAPDARGTRAQLRAPAFGLT